MSHLYPLIMTMQMFAPTVPAPAPSVDPSELDFKEIQGRWVATKVEIDGFDSTRALRRGKNRDEPILAHFDKDEYSLFGMSQGRIRIDASVRPKRIDRLDEGRLVSHGIYDLSEGKLKICWTSSDKARPTEFKTESGKSSFTLFFFVRPGAAEVAPKN